MVKDFKVTLDDIVSYTGGIVKFEIIDSKMKLNDKGSPQSYWIRAKIKANPNEVAKTIAALREEKNTKKELNELKQEFEKITKEMTRLKESNKKDKTTKNKYETEVNKISALDFVNTGLALFRKGNYQLALDSFDTAIELYPGYAYAYVLRGRTLGMLDRPKEEVLKAFEAASKLEPEPTRGFVYYQLGIYYNFRPQSKFEDVRLNQRERYNDYQKAVDNFKKALALEKNKNNINFINYYLGVSFYNMGSCWNDGRYVPKNYANAFKWFTESVKYNNKDAQYELGFFYIKPSTKQNEEGRIVQADLIKAYMWFNLAAAQMHNRASMERYLVSLDMNMKEITEAQRLSLKLMPEGETTE